MLQDIILDYLKTNCRGRANARNKVRIMADLDISDERIFREMIHQLRLAEVPILSRSKNPSGYYIAADETEAIEALQELNGRALDLHLVVKQIKRGLRKQFPDMQLPLDLSA